MRLRVLEDNNTFIDMYYVGEPAVSYYIEDDSSKILFDTGYSNAFMTNAKKMNIDLDKINKVIISHGHDDHTGGLKYLFTTRKDIELIAHPDSFYYKEDLIGEYIGSSMKEEELSKNCILNLSKSPIRVSKNIIYLGEIPSLNDFEKRYILGKTIINGKKYLMM